jgi:GT2 family glycosyltransferase
MNSSKNSPLISIVIPNHNGAKFLENCLRSLQSQTYQTMEIVVVDNASVDASLDIVRAVDPRVLVVRNDRNLGFAGAVNAGVLSSHGDWIAVLNNDTELQPSWLEECIQAIHNHPDATFFACRILDFADRDRIYSAGDCFLRAGVGYRRGQELQDRAEFHNECRIFSASGCAALYHRQTLREMGGFDARFFAYLEDSDLGLRLHTAGHYGYYAARAEVYHHGGGTSGGEFSPLAVRLRTRNSLLLLLKSMPGELLIRCLPMIAMAQLSWIMRVLFHLRAGSCLRGFGEALFLAPAMIRERGRMRASWGKSSVQHLWQEILNSESLAREDFASAGTGSRSTFLKWYFRIF